MLPGRYHVFREAAEQQAVRRQTDLGQWPGRAAADWEVDMVDGVRELCRQEGVFAAPEGGAIWSATKQLLHQGWLKPDEHVLLLNTGSAQKYMDNLKGQNGVLFA